ncbi:MAG: hypothetical protein GX275_08810 [Clostridiales bacterium]|nr:hypothetical protein [Clostridiales bacterium]
MYYWNKDSKLIISLEGKGYYSFDPNTKVMEEVAEEDNEENLKEEFTAEEIDKYRKEFNITNEEELFENGDKSRFYYYGNENEVIFCNTNTGEKEVVFSAMGVPKWTSKGDKVIYIIPRDGFESIKEKKIYTRNFSRI